MFAYLVYNIDKPLPIQKILFDLWPDTPQDKASDLFHTNLNHVRQVLRSLGGKRNVIHNNHSYSIFLEKTFCDYLLFNHFIRQSLTVKDKRSIKLLQYSSSLYQGEFLDNTNFGWAVENVEYFNTLYIKSLLTLSEYFIGEKKYENALFYLKNIIKINPILENAHVMIMKALYHIGDRQALICQYEKLCGILSEEMGTCPQQETKKIFYELINR